MGKALEGGGAGTKRSHGGFGLLESVPCAIEID